MFGTQHSDHHHGHSYEQVPHCDSDDERAFAGISHSHSTVTNRSHSNSITDLLRQTAVRRMRQIEANLLHSDRAHGLHDDAVMPMDDDDDILDLEDPLRRESTALISNAHPHSMEMSEINLNETHAPSDDDEYDDFVFLLFLDGTKRRAGLMASWRVVNFKDRHFKHELDDGKKVRLIYRGKLLTDLSTMTSHHIPTDGFIHVSISKNGNLFTARNGEGGTSADHDPNYDNFDDGMDDEAVARRLQQQEMERGGFRRGPYNPMFDGMRMRPIGGPFGRREDPNEDPELRRIRERKEFLCGMFLGSVAGIWILVFLILASRNGNYSRQFRLGITVGVAINLMVQLTVHEPVTPDEADDPAADATAEEADPTVGVPDPADDATVS